MENGVEKSSKLLDSQTRFWGEHLECNPCGEGGAV